MANNLARTHQLDQLNGAQKAAILYMVLGADASSLAEIFTGGRNPAAIAPAGASRPAARDRASARRAGRTTERVSIRAKTRARRHSVPLRFWSPLRSSPKMLRPPATLGLAMLASAWERPPLTLLVPEKTGDKGRLRR